MSGGKISDSVGPSAWTGGDSAKFEAVATRIRFDQFDFELEQGDRIRTPDGVFTFDRAVRDVDGMWTLRYEGGRGHGPSWAAMKLRKGEWELVDKDADGGDTRPGVQEL